MFIVLFIVVAMNTGCSDSVAVDIPPVLAARLQNMVSDCQATTGTGNTATYAKCLDARAKASEPQQGDADAARHAVEQLQQNAQSSSEVDLQKSSCQKITAYMSLCLLFGGLTSFLVFIGVGVKDTWKGDIVTLGLAISGFTMVAGLGMMLIEPCKVSIRYIRSQRK